jgi:hypothetical protein
METENISLELDEKRERIANAIYDMARNFVGTKSSKSFF